MTNLIEQDDAVTENAEAAKVDGRNNRAKTVGGVGMRLTHPLLCGGSVLVRRFHGRSHWEVMQCTWANGVCEDGLTAMLQAEVELENHRAEVPRLVGRNEWATLDMTGGAE